MPTHSGISARAPPRPACGRSQIDQSFVTDALVEGQNAGIVESVVNAAHCLGRQFVAEGVEDEATLAYLDRLGADYAQVLLIGRPVPPEKIRLAFGLERRGR